MERKGTADFATRETVRERRRAPAGLPRQEERVGSLPQQNRYVGNATGSL